MTALIGILLGPALRHALTIVATYLVAWGLMDPSMTEHFYTIMSGLILGLAGIGWSAVSAVTAAKKTK